LKTINGKSLISNDKPSAYWWERIVVIILFILALICVRSAHGADKSAVCQPKTMQALARICMAKGEYDKAESLIEKALSAVNKDEDKSACLIDLAWVYKNQGRLEQAGQSCLLGMQLQQQVYYADHPYVAYTLRILGSIYLLQSDFGRADESFDKAIAIIRKYHSAQDPVVASFEIDAARLLVAEGKFAQAEEKYEGAVRVIIDYYGPDHLYTAGVMSDVAKLYYLQGRFDEAQAVLDYSLDIQRNTYSSDNRQLIGNQLAMAKILRARGNLEQAKHLLTDALEILENHSSAYEPLQAEIRMVLADIYANTSKIADAQSACVDSTGA
jgi:tetratricopeptide (TPR) repeat protein